MPNICYSSETYHLDPQDLFILKDSSLSDEVNVSDEVVLLIGHNPIWIDKSTGTPDTLLKGRAVLEKAVADKVPYVPVRIAFIPQISRFDFISPLIRVLRYKHKFYSSNIYHIDPFEIRSKKLNAIFVPRPTPTSSPIRNTKWTRLSVSACMKNLKKACLPTDITTVIRLTLCFAAFSACRIP